MLNLQQQRFVAAYIESGNATTAAIKAGYSKKTAHAQGSRLLKHAEVKRAIKKPLQKAFDSIELTADRVLKEIARLSFFDIRKLVDNTGKPLPLHELDDDTAAAIVGLDVVNVGNEDKGVAEILKFKLADKKGALDLAARHLRLLTDKVEVTGKDGAPLESANPNELARRVAFLLHKGLRAQKD
jgi:phage terminase small subunit